MSGVAGVSIELRHFKSGRWNGISINSNNVDAEILCGAVAELVNSLNRDEGPQIDTTVPVTLEVRPPAAEKPSRVSATEEAGPEPESDIATDLDNVDLEQDDGTDLSDPQTENEAPRKAEEIAEDIPAEEHAREHDRAEKRVADLGGVRASPIWQSAEIARMNASGFDAASIASALGCDLAVVEATLQPAQIDMAQVNGGREIVRKQPERKPKAKVARPGKKVGRPKGLKPQAWTNEDIARLKQLKTEKKSDGSSYTNREIAEIMGRTTAAVDNRMYVLNKQATTPVKSAAKQEDKREFAGRAGDLLDLECVGCSKPFCSVDPDQGYCARCRRGE